jgi:hypothetical protein
VSTKQVDLFPAIIYLAPPGSVPVPTDLTFRDRPQGTRKVDRCRVALVNGSLYIVVDSPDGPKVVFREKAVFYERSADRKFHHAQTETGKVMVFGKDENCGCGSRLRSWSPFGATARSSADPTS